LKEETAAPLALILLVAPNLFCRCSGTHASSEPAGTPAVRTAGFIYFLGDYFGDCCEAYCYG